MQQLTLLVSLSLFTSCQNDDKGSNGTIETFEQQIIVDYEDKRQIQGFIDCINDVNLIPLEMDSAFLSSNNTLKVTSDKLIFLDNEKDRIEVFNHQGDYLNTGKYTVPESYFKKQEKRIDEDLMEITLEMINKDWVHSIGFFHEATQYVYFVSSKKGSYYTLYDRTTEETYTANWAEIPQGWIDILRPFIAVEGNTFYTLLTLDGLEIFSKMKVADHRLQKVQQQYEDYKRTHTLDAETENYVCLTYRLD